MPAFPQDSLLIGTSANALGMADAWVSFPKDINIINYNPAGLGYLKHDQISVSHEQWIAGLNLEHVSYMKQLPDNSAAGISARILYTPEFEAFDRDENYLGKVRGSDIAITLGYGRLILAREHFAGVNIKYIQQNLGDYTSISSAIDIGWLSCFDSEFYFINEFKAGLAARNFGINLKKAGDENETLPACIVLGASGNILNVRSLEDHKLFLSTDTLVRVVDEKDIKIHLGVEYAFRDFFFLRTGYKIKYDLNGFTSGLGINYSLPAVDLVLNYSLVLNEFLNNNHLIEIVIKFADNRAKIDKQSSQPKEKSKKEKMQEIEKEFDNYLEE